MMRILLAVLALIVTALIGGVRNVRFWHKADIAKRQLLEKCYDLATAFAIKTPIKESRAAECKSAG